MGGKAKKGASNVVKLTRRDAGRARLPAFERGVVVGYSDGALLVECSAYGSDPLRARTAAPLTPTDVARLIDARESVALVFDGDGTSAIVLGPVRDVPPPAPEASVDAIVDGKTVRLEGMERIELRCGEASIILTADGKVLIQGTYISSRSEGANRIRGGSVELN